MRVVGLRPAALAVLVLVVTSCGSDGATSGSDAPSCPPAAAEERAFFSQTATGGSLAEGTLTLTGVSPSVVAVAERPVRSIERTGVDDFTDSFADRFEGDDPNAILSFVVDGGEEVVPLTVSEPDYDAGDATLTYRVVEIDDGDATQSGFGVATLVIDSGALQASEEEVVLAASPEGSPPPNIRNGTTLDDPRNTEVVAERDDQGMVTLTVSDAVLDGHLELVNETGGRLQLLIKAGNDEPFTRVSEANSRSFFEF